MCAQKLFCLVRLSLDRFIKFLRCSSSVLYVFLFFSVTANAGETFLVNSTADEPDKLRGDGNCETISGGCSLRAALEESNALLGMETVNIASGTYPLSYIPITDFSGGEHYRALQILDGLNLRGIGNAVLDGQGTFPILWARAHEALIFDSAGDQVSLASVAGRVAFSPFVDPDPTNLNVVLNMHIDSPTGQTDDRDLYISTFSGITRYSDETGDFIETFIGNSVNGTPIIPSDFAFHSNPDVGVLVADFSPGGSILQFNRDTGAFIGTFIAGSGFSQPSTLQWHFFRNPAGGIGTWGLLVGDASTGRIDRYDESGNFVENFAANLGIIRDMIVRNDTLYVSSDSRNAVESYDLVSGNYLGQFVDAGAGGLSDPGWLAWGPQGDLYVVSRGTNQILAFDQYSGEFARIYVDGADEGMSVGPLVFRANINTDGPGSNVSNITLQNGRSTVLYFSAGLTNDLGASTILNEVTIKNNVSNTFGGGISNRGSMTIYRSTISSNNVIQPSTGGGLTARGGGIFNSGYLTLSGSLISDNFASKGGGISHFGSDLSRLSVRNSTISGNRSNGKGGGIDASSSYVEIVNSTITLNTTQHEGGESDPYGGGIFVGPESRVALANSIVANNTDRRTHFSSEYSPDCYSVTPSALRSYRNNIIGVLNSNCDITDHSSGALTAIMYGTGTSQEDIFDAGLLELADNGGPTHTHALSAGSPAIDAVTWSSSYECEYDQRGEPRPADGNYDSIRDCDIGAYEVLRQTTMLEAEDADLFGALLASTCEGASGGRCVSAFVQDVYELEAPNASHRMVFDIYIENHSLYNIAGWVKASAPEDNSFWVSLDGGTPFIWDIQDTAGLFETQLISNRGTGTEGNPEVDEVSFLMDEGHHTLEIFLREDSTMLDRISLVPVALEPVSMLSLNQPVQASSEALPQFSALNVVDGNSSTRWQSAEADEEWVRVDLGETKQVSSVTLDWAADYGEEYQIQISGDGENWTTLYEQSSGNGGTETLALNGVGQYVRFLGVSRGASSAYSLEEFEIYGAPVITSTPSVLSAEFFVSDDWGSGYCGSFLVTNMGSESISGWEVTVNLNGATRRSDSWNGNFSGTTGVITVGPGFSWNQTIGAGATESSVGICANRDNPGSASLPIIISSYP